MMECEHRTRSVEHVGWPYKADWVWTEKIVEIHYEGEWMRVARTDFKDDVCTTNPNCDTFDGYVRKLQNSRYGVRVRDNGTFSIIDAYSDG